MGMCCYYSCSHVRGRDTNYVFFFFVLFYTYMVVDAFFVEVSKVFWVDFLLPFMVAPNARHAEMIIHQTLDKIISDADKEDENQKKDSARQAMEEANAAFE